MIEVGSQVGPYEIVAEIGSGGMATLFRARQSGPASFSRDVAIKVVHPRYGSDSDITTMFLDEARLTACIQHPNVVHVESLGQLEGQHYIVMELVDGVTLAAVLVGLYGRGARMPLDIGVAICGQVAAGLHAAHECVDPRGRPLNLIHRDVSPTNVLLGRDGTVKLIDFGVAKAKHRLSRSTVGGGVKGKIAYMAPEALALAPIDRRADVFSLGVVLWETLTLSRLFHSPNDLEAMMNVRDMPIPSIRERREDVSDKLDFVVSTMMSRALDERFQTAAAARAAMLTSTPDALLVDAAAIADLVRAYADGARHTILDGGPLAAPPVEEREGTLRD